jgi:hypothetical protein
MIPSEGYDHAIAAVRDGNADLFTRLAEEYQLPGLPLATANEHSARKLTIIVDYDTAPPGGSP